MADTTETLNFPDHFPEGCPPNQTPDADGDVFRFVIGESIDNEADFRTHHEMKSALTASQCRRRTLSVFRDLSYAEVKLAHINGNFPERFKFRSIAKGTLSPSDGKLAQSGADPGHYEWWPYEGVERAKSFAIVPRN